MSDTDAFDFNTRLRRLDTPAACAALYRAAIEPYGFDTFACGELDLEDRDRTVFFIIDWPDDWRRFYLSSGLVHKDPLIDALAVRREAFTWSDLRRDRKLGKLGRHVLEDARARGWSEGLVVPLSRGEKRFGLVSLVGRESCRVGPEARAFLCLISLCLHTHVRSLMVTQGFAAPPAGLTDREMACIRLVARGNSDADVATHLGIAASTAHEFIEKAKRKLKTRSRVEMVAIAVSLGIVDL